MKFVHKIILPSLIIGAFDQQPLFAQQITAPTQKVVNKSFAIIVDQHTYDKCKSDILAYRQVIEKDGLPTFIVSHTWNRPEEVKEEILKLYKNNKLEGIVLIGDIPIPMIRKAQHLATAFKMDEKYDIKDSSIPSDRFYDDFDLAFDYLQKDEKEPLFYYNLGIDSKNKIQSDIYSGRIKPILAEGKDPYQQISHYLKKVVTARSKSNKIDNVIAYLGDGTLSNSLTAWSPELYRLEEQFPNTFKSSTQAQAFRFDSWEFPKDELVNQFRRNDLDIAFIHEHGMPERMYISGDFATNDLSSHYAALQYGLKKMAARDIKKKSDFDNFYNNYLAKYNLSAGIIEGYDKSSFKEEDSLRFSQQGIEVTEVDGIKPNNTLTIFDACYNGDFREKDYIAGRFIFSEGQSLVALANSVSILQDVNTTHLIGILGMGVSVGKWAQQNHVLESHIIGDPTFTFAKNNGEDWSWVLREKDNNALLAALKNAKYADSKNVILTQLYKNGYAGLPELLEQSFHESTHATTRFTCLHLANLLGGDIQLALLKKGSKDSDEFIRRHSINTMGDVGHPSLINYLLEAYLENQHAARVLFSVKISLYSFDKEKIREVADKLFERANALDKVEFKEKFYKDQFQGFYDNIDAAIFGEKSSNKRLGISSLKNVNYHPSVDKYIALVKNNNEDTNVRIAMLESLAWFGNSYRKAEIISACEEIAQDVSIPEEIRNQSIRTLNTIK